MVNIKISLHDNNNGTYLAGQTLHGSAEISLDSYKKINEFFVVIQGIARCDWTEKKNRSTVDYGSKDVLMNAKVTLFPNGTMLAGVHRYNFECILPPQLPASYEAKLGSIRYEIEAKLDIPWAFDEKVKRQFTVTRVEDLNLHQNAMLAVKNEEIKTFCCFPCRSDPCILTLTIPQSGYVPGQVLNYHFEYHNKSNINIHSIIAVLRRVITYVSDCPNPDKIKYEFEELLELDLGRLREVNNFASCEGTLEIPHILVPSNTHCSRVVRVSYELGIVVVPRGCHLCVAIHTPIIIGSIPLRTGAELQAQNVHDPMVSNAPTIAKISPQNFGEHNECVSELPPTTFEQSQTMPENKKIDETDTEIAY